MITLQSVRVRSDDRKCENWWIGSEISDDEKKKKIITKIDRFIQCLSVVVVKSFSMYSIESIHIVNNSNENHCKMPNDSKRLIDFS